MKYPTHNKKARVEFKNSRGIKNLLLEAATLSGLDLTACILKSSEEKAREIITRHQSLTLDKTAQQKLCEALTNPPKTSDALVALMHRERLPSR